LQESEITTTVLKLAAAAIASGVTMQALKPLVVEWITLDTFFAVFAQGLIAGGAGLVVYGVCAHFLRVPEQQEFLKTFTRKVLRKAKTEEVVTAN
jgi:hypothetical protein